ncbi:MAG: hypothetical protein KAH00_05780 [Cocleimonas sp.]|nr:hypothetical protein [Cocleimonas sp.]
MKKMRVRANVLVPIRGVRLIITGLLLVSLVACEEKKPETTSINLSLPGIDGVQPPPVAMMGDEDHTLLAPIAKQEPATTEIQQSVAGQQYLKSAHLVANSKPLFAPNLLDSLFVGDNFYPLGWSPDGEKFAYAVARGEEGGHEMFSGVFIQDLVTDKVTWTLKKTGPQSGNTIENFWGENYQKIQAQLDKNKIKLGGAGLKINTTSLAYNGANFDYTVKSKQTNDGQIVSYRVLLTSSVKGSKEISKATLKTINRQNGAYGNKEKVAVIGYFQGADKARVATVLGLMETGWEGTRVMRYKIIGASLKYGKWR